MSRRLRLYALHRMTRVSCQRTRRGERAPLPERNLNAHAPHHHPRASKIQEPKWRKQEEQGVIKRTKEAQHDPPLSNRDTLKGYTCSPPPPQKKVMTDMSRKDKHLHRACARITHTRVCLQHPSTPRVHTPQLPRAGKVIIHV